MILFLAHFLKNMSKNNNTFQNITVLKYHIFEKSYNFQTYFSKIVTKRKSSKVVAMLKFFRKLFFNEFLPDLKHQQIEPIFEQFF